jgi:hypothetical protein
VPLVPRGAPFLDELQERNRGPSHQGYVPLTPRQLARRFTRRDLRNEKVLRTRRGLRMRQEEKYEWPEADPCGQLTGEAWEIYGQLAGYYVHCRQSEAGQNGAAKELARQLVDLTKGGKGEPDTVVRSALVVIDVAVCAGLRAVAACLAERSEGRGRGGASAGSPAQPRRSP